MKVKHTIFIFILGTLIGYIGIYLIYNFETIFDNSIAGKLNQESSKKSTNAFEGRKGRNSIQIEKKSKSSLKPELTFGKITDRNNQVSNYQGKITIAIFGDSMTDLMGANLLFLQSELEKYYPQAEFNLLNYGVGAQNIKDGYSRLEQDYQYQDRSHSSLLKVNPDIIIVQPFDYNPLGVEDGGLNSHGDYLDKIIKTIQDKTTARIIILSTIAPNKAMFAQLAEGESLPRDEAWEKANTICSYLENTINFANSRSLPLVNVYNQTLQDNKEGNLKYIDSKDHIHQSQEGNILIAKLLAQKIWSLKLFK